MNEKPKTKGPPPRRPESEPMTQSKLAAVLGVSRQLIAHHRKSGKGPKTLDVEAWVEFLAAHGREGSLPPEVRARIAEERLRLVRAQADKVELENAARKKLLIDRDFVTRSIGDVVGLFSAELDRMAQELPATLKGKTEIQIRDEVVKQKRAVRRLLDSHLEKFVREANG